MPAKEEKNTKGDAAVRAESEGGNSPSFDLQRVRELYEMMVEQGLEFLEVKSQDAKYRLNRQWTAPEVHVSHAAPPRRHVASSPASATTSSASKGASSVPPGNAITSPLAGVFYRASSPTATPFAKEGDVVDAGQTLCIIEAMKVMNEIKAESRCRVVRIPAENARPVTAGQPLFYTEPA